MIYKEMTGRLGNQLFQYAMVKAYKEKYHLNDDIILDFSMLKKLGTKEQGFYNQLSHFNVTDYKEGTFKASFITKLKIYYHKFLIYYLFKNNEQKVYEYQNKNQNKLNKSGIFYFSYGYYDFPKCKKTDKYFFGDFESPKYFDSIREELLKEFTPKEDKVKSNTKLYEAIENSESVCISIRRGDFITDDAISKKHLVCTEKYYYDAIEEIKKRVKKPVFVVFSDDVKWCKENMNFPEDTLYESGKDPVWEKLRLMYSCKHFIISNSTFSWWAEYLSRNKKKVVIAPSKWKNYSYKKNNEQFDIYEDDWVLIPVGDKNE